MDEQVGEESSALDGEGHEIHEGKALFNNPLPGTNGRSCATCHAKSEHLALNPTEVAARFAKSPGDPLFNRIDADDPTAATPTYDHVKAGLIRVTLKLADNLDVVDQAGNVITNADRTIEVWRGVPSIENIAYTAPYQYDGRFATLEEQASGALHAHSQIDHEPSTDDLEDIAAFGRSVFSGPEARLIAEAMEHGKTPPDVDRHFPPHSPEAAGQVLFNNICAQCHGSPTTNVIVNQAVHDSLFAVIKGDGTIDITGTLPNFVSIPANVHHDLPDHHDVNIGISGLQTFRQLGILGNLLPKKVDFPQYRIRFYTDASRAEVRFDLPPPPPGIGPDTAPLPFTTDPGRAIITGDPNDWDTFEVPQLRGIAHTAPYFHDGQAADLREVLDIYSRFILPEIVPLNTPGIYPPEAGSPFPESLSPAQKDQLLAFLQTL